MRHVTPNDLLDRLWVEGAGIDDRLAIMAARETNPEPVIADELALWNDWITCDDGHATGTHEQLAQRLASDPACRLLIIAIELRAAISGRDHETIDDALEAIDRLIIITPREDERGTTAHSAADLALAETALYGKDLPAARRCLEPVISSGPLAMRITGFMRMATLALANTDVTTAQKRARQALTLARTTNRRGQGNQAQLLLGLISAMAGDTEHMRQALEPLLIAEPNNATTRFLLAGLEDNQRALELLAEGLTTAASSGDALGYALCALVGSRRYVAMGKRADALLTMSMVRVQLDAHAPQLLAVLDTELETWKATWGDAEFAQAERAAMDLLSKS